MASLCTRVRATLLSRQCTTLLRSSSPPTSSCCCNNKNNNNNINHQERQFHDYSSNHQAHQLLLRRLQRYSYTTHHAVSQRMMSITAIISRQQQAEHQPIAHFHPSLTDEELSLKFINPRVQRLLAKMSKPDAHVTLKSKSRLKIPTEITLMTDEELAEAQEKAHKHAQRQMQMPPVLPERKPMNKVLSEDPEIEGFSTSKMVFTDITAGLHERDRTIVVREKDGTLRLADWDIRDRMCQTYYPMFNRKIKPHGMFEPQHFQRMLEDQQYRYVLENACSQFEPDHPKFIEICHKVYDHCDTSAATETLRSTRFYGPMVFHLVCKKRIANLINNFMINDNIDQSLYVANLYHLVWSEAPTREISSKVPYVWRSAKRKVEYILELLQAETLLTDELRGELQDFLNREEARSKESETNDSSSSDSSSDSDNE